MPQTASLGQAQSSRKMGGVVAGLGAAFIASAITLTMMMSGPAPATAPAQATATGPQCQVVLRQFLASTNGGGGTIRLREGNYLSPPIVLGAQPQTVTFPVARPQTVAAPPEVITIEGNATGVVLTSPVTSWRHVFDSVNGVLAFESRWMPVKGC